MAVHKWTSPLVAETKNPLVVVECETEKREQLLYLHSTERERDSNLKLPLNGS